MAISLEQAGGRKRLISSTGMEKSASARKRYSPCASITPRWTARPLPGRSSCRTIRLGKLRVRLLGYFQGAVRTGVFDNKHFGGIILFFQKCKCLSQGAGQAGFFIMSRDDNGKERGFQGNRLRIKGHWSLMTSEKEDTDQDEHQITNMAIKKAHCFLFSLGLFEVEDISCAS